MFHGSIRNRGLESSDWLCTVATKSSYPDIGVCEINPLTGVGRGDMIVGIVAIPVGGDCSKNGGVVVAIAM